MQKLRLGSLFAGIGGNDLGLERTGGFEAVWQVEIDDYARRVLAKHWPHVRRHDDVCTFPPKPETEWGCDVICGGFPCQDISVAGRGAGIEGKRSGLWREFARIIRVLRPRIVIVENSPALTGRGLGTVLRDLAECGLDAEWTVLPAAAFGAPHLRWRLFVVSYRHGEFATLGRHRQMGRQQCAGGVQAEAPCLASDAPCVGSQTRRAKRKGQQRIEASDQLFDNPDAGGAVANTDWRHVHQEGPVFSGGPAVVESDFWASDPGICGVAYGVPNRVDRVRCCGNAVVPQIVEWIGRRILESYAR